MNKVLVQTFNPPKFKLWKVFLILAAWYGLASALYYSGFSQVINLNISVQHNNRFNKDLNGTLSCITPVQLKLYAELLQVIVSSLFYYCLLNLFYTFLKNKSRFKYYFVWGLLFFGIYTAGQLFMDYYFSTPINFTGIPQAMQKIIMLYVYGIRIGFHFLTGLLKTAIIIFILKITVARDNKEYIQQLQIQAAQLELEKLKVEYNFLRSQINPHFLHNSLNFLYAKSLPYSTELSEGIMTLSDIMRYSLSIDAEQNGLVLLSKEIEHIRNVIKMHQLRFSNQLQIEFNVNGIVGSTRILPFVLITIVENAFKHGDIRDEKFPLTILLNLDDSFIYFSCLNKKKEGPKELSTGVGLDNTQKRLQMVYQNKADMQIVDTIDSYEVKLKIPYYND